MSSHNQELRFAMSMAQDYWHGTSITEGAFALMEYVRRVSPEQFAQSQIEEPPSEATRTEQQSSEDA